MKSLVVLQIPHLNCLRESDRGAADSLCSPRILVAENIIVQSTLSLDGDNIADRDHRAILVVTFQTNYANIFPESYSKVVALSI